MGDPKMKTEIKEAFRDLSTMMREMRIGVGVSEELCAKAVEHMDNLLEDHRDLSMALTHACSDLSKAPEDYIRMARSEMGD